MLVALIILQLTVLAFANPFHKCPYVFLLDVGNEELEKVNTEQIRISKQGGSLALRYPAIGNGEDIAHVRVSGIDFGTDLKANIVDGGPGYKYVVLVLMGNPGVAFDAVITIQTMPNQSDETNQLNVESSDANNQITENNDSNDSAEDLSESGEGGDSEEASQVSVIKENAELTQESSNVYNYAVNEALSGYGNNVHYGDSDEDENNDRQSSYNKDDVYENDIDEKDIHTSYKQNKNEEDDDSAAEFEDNISNKNIEKQFESQPKEVQYTNNDYYSMDDDQNYESDYGNQEQTNGNIHQEYQAFQQNLYNGGRYSQKAVLPVNSRTVFLEEPGDNGGALDLEEIFGEEYEDYDNRRYNSDSNNNNFIDRNDGSAVAY